jgi:hypothetical protein
MGLVWFGISHHISYQFSKLVISVQRIDYFISGKNSVFTITNLIPCIGVLKCSTRLTENYFHNGLVNLTPQVGTFLLFSSLRISSSVVNGNQADAGKVTRIQSRLDHDQKYKALTVPSLELAFVLLFSSQL